MVKTKIMNIQVIPSVCMNVIGIITTSFKIFKRFNCLEKARHFTFGIKIEKHIPKYLLEIFVDFFSN